MIGGRERERERWTELAEVIGRGLTYEVINAAIEECRNVEGKI